MVRRFFFLRIRLVPKQNNLTPGRLDLLPHHLLPRRDKSRHHHTSVACKIESVTEFFCKLLISIGTMHY